MPNLPETRKSPILSAEIVPYFRSFRHLQTQLMVPDRLVLPTGGGGSKPTGINPLTGKSSPGKTVSRITPRLCTIPAATQSGSGGRTRGALTVSGAAWAVGLPGQRARGLAAY
jgi:hypothetical protein